MGDGGVVEEQYRADNQLGDGHEQHLPPETKCRNRACERHERSDDGGRNGGERPGRGRSVDVDEVAGGGEGE